MTVPTRFKALLAAVPVMGALLGATPAHAQQVAAEAAPAEWLAYAEASTKTLASWLQEDSEPALRFRADLDARRSDPAQPAPAVALKIWVSEDGAVTRVEMPQLADSEAAAAARTAIVGRKLGVPPKKMLLPMNLSVELAPAPEPAAPAASAQPDQP